MKKSLSLARAIDGVSEFLGQIGVYLTVAVIIVGFYNVAVRYLGRFIGAQLSSNFWIELQKYLFSAIFLAMFAYNLKHEVNVRVDFLYANWSPRRRAWVNLWGTLQLTQAVLPLLKRKDDTRIVMINTMSVQKIEESFGGYAASKAALATATKTLAVELGRYGVRVNAVHPGYIWGPSVEWYLNHLAEEQGRTFQEVYDEIAGETCLKYLPSSEEIAGAVVFFASPLAKPVTGQALSVNAGHWIG